MEIKIYNHVTVSVHYENLGKKKEKSSCTFLYSKLSPGEDQEQHDFKS